MRVAIDVCPTQVGRSSSRGLGSYVRGLLSGLARLDGGDEWTLVGYRRGQADFPVVPGLQARRFAIPIPPLPEAVAWLVDPLLLRLALRRLDVDVYHATYFDAPTFRFPTVATLYDLIPLRFPADYFRFPLRRAGYQVQMRLASAARRIIAISEHTRRDVEALTSIDPARVRVVPLGIADRFFAPCPAERQAEARRRYGLDGRFILYVGEFDARKNWAGLLRVLARLGERYPDLQLVATGRMGRLKPRVLEAAAQSGVAERVCLLGVVPLDDLWALYHQAELLAFPSLYEGFGLPPVEAMACGTPVVAYAVSSLPEVVGDGGLLVPLGDEAAFADAVDGLLADPSYRAEVAGRGRVRARPFTWEQAARATRAVYAEAAETGRGG